MFLPYNIIASGATIEPIQHVVQHELFTIPIGVSAEQAATFHPAIRFLVDNLTVETARGLALPFTNHMLMLLLASLVLLVILPLAFRKSSLIPHGFNNFIESICVYLRDQMVRPALRGQTDLYIKFIWTLFFFILTCNLLGLFPLDGVLYLLFRKKHIGGTATTNIWVTGMLAFLSFLIIHISGIIHQGPVNYFKNFIPHVPWPMIPFMYVLETISTIIRPCALAIRLFANMMAGHTVLASLIMIAFNTYHEAGDHFNFAVDAVSAVALLGSAVFFLMEVFVAFLQAYIFTFLTVLFISQAIHPEH